MIHLLFMRLPQFVEDLNNFNIKLLKIRPENLPKNSKTKSINDLNDKSTSVAKAPEAAEIELEESKPLKQDEMSEVDDEIPVPEEEPVVVIEEENVTELPKDEYINSVGVRFTHDVDTYVP